MKKENFLFAIIGILAGFIAGFFLANSINRNAPLQTPTAQIQTNSPFAATQNNPQTQSVDIKENQGAMLPEVAETLDKAQKEPNNFAAQINAGQMYERIQNTAKANEFLQRAAQAHQDTFEDLTTLGNGFFDLKNFEEAEKWYSKALEKKPDDADVRTDLGSTFMERAQPDIDRAIKEYQIVLSKDPNHENALFNLSLALMRKGDAADAQETLAKLERANPNSSLIAKLKQKLSQNQK
ncbi:MAG: tetratricopeptide repeat protein [Pyrinomonadaceae bacterium]